MTGKLRLHTIVSRPFDENTTILWRIGRKDCLVVDPGLEPELILDFLGEQQLTPAAILNTHGHADHIAGNEALKQAFPQAPLLIGVNEERLLADPWLNVSAQFGFRVVSPPADRLLSDGEELDYAGLRLRVLDLPGHSPGHVVFLHLDEPAFVIAGDTLFREGIGRSDFPGGDSDLLLDGIRERLFTLPSDTVVYPGHGPLTTVGHEKKYNPYVGEHERLA